MSKYLILLLLCLSNFLFSQKSKMTAPKNVFGDELALCCSDPMTGYFRNGFCMTIKDDYGTHIVCAKVTDDFLQYSKSLGNDLITPLPEHNFPGLKAGDQWCLCISRWMEAVHAGHAPPINLAATHQKALEYVSLEVLQQYDLSKQN